MMSTATIISDVNPLDSPNCFICFNRCGLSSRNANTLFPRNEKDQSASEDSLLEIITTILNRNLEEDQIHSNVVCKSCTAACMEFNDLYKRLSGIKNDIIISYNNTIMKCDKIFGFDEDTIIMKADDVNNIDEETEEIDENEIILSSVDAKHLGAQDGSEIEEYLIDGRKVMFIRRASDVETTVVNSMQPPAKILVEREEPENEDLDGIDLADEEMDTPVADAQLKIESELHETEQQNTDQEYFDENDDGTNMVEISTETENNYDFLESAQDENEYDHANLSSADDGESSEKRTSKATNILPKTKIKQENTDIAVENYEEHQKSIFVRDGMKFLCQLCPSSDIVFDARNIAIHLKAEHDERVHICDICGADFRKRGELTLHLDEHLQGNEDGEFTCDVCGRIFSNLRLYRVHRRIHYNASVKSWTCKECNKKYSSKNLLDEHMNMHTGDRPYKCTHCPKDFASKYTFTAHLKIHSERERPHKCKTCDKSFYSHQNLAQHERTHTGVKEFVCDICNKAFGTAHNLDVHKIVHTNYRPFICRTCGKAFARRAEIKDHERTHTGERPYNCDICGASFAQRSNLMSHKRATHLNDKRYKCDQCDKCFKRRRLLDYHIKATHTGERPYTCETCGSSFVYPEHYKKHLRIHSGVKPFKCEVCDKAFNSRDNRNAHRFVHSDKKPYECLYCGQGFMRKPLLISHMKTQNHENDRIIMNQPRLAAKSEDGDDADVKPTIESNVVYVNDTSYEINEDFEAIDEEEEDTLTGEHIIVDGQVQFSEEHIEELATEENSDILTENHVDLSSHIGDDQNMFVTDETQFCETDEAQFIETEDGPVQLVQIHMTNTDGKNDMAWVNIVNEYNK